MKIAKIGQKYIYPNDEKRREFELKKFSKNVFYFKCGHWCTDSVFSDLINTKTGKQNFELDPNFYQQKLNL